MFENLRDGEGNPKEVLRCQVRFQSQLNEIKLGGNKSGISRGYYFLLSKAKYKPKYGEGLKILTPKQMPQRLPIAIAQVKAGNNSKNLFTEVRQMIYSLYRSKKLLKKYIKT